MSNPITPSGPQPDEVIPLSRAQRMPEAAMSNLDIAIRKQVPTVPHALKALAAMERQLTAAKTYEDLRRVIKEASALFRHAITRNDNGTPSSILDAVIDALAVLSREERS